MNVPTGVWQREWIRRNNGPADRGVLVRYVQTSSVFGDLRIPETRPDLGGATSLADLSDDQLAQLAEQNGFAGVLTMSGTTATWQHEIDFQITEKAPDAGRIEPAGAGNMLEHALDGSYVERWTAVPRVAGPEAGEFAARVTRDDKTAQLLAVAGQRFIYARARSRALPVGKSLKDMIKNPNATRDYILAWLDCEISYGTTHGWWIENSTLPWLQGKKLAFADRIAIGGDGHPYARTPSPGETWTFPVDSLPPDEMAAVFVTQ